MGIIVLAEDPVGKHARGNAICFEFIGASLRPQIVMGPYQVGASVRFQLLGLGWTVGSTIFQMWLGALGTFRGL